jgi:hypothetical protein
MSNLIFGVICETPVWTSVVMEWSFSFLSGVSAVGSCFVCFGVPVLWDELGGVGGVESLIHATVF